MKKELPTSAEILARIPRIKGSTETDVEELRKWVFEKTQILQENITTFIEKTDLREDPDIYQERLYRYHLLLGGMSGLVAGLYERAHYLSFKKLTEETRTATAAVSKKALNAGDRELYAKGDVSDLKALRNLLDGVIGNLESRLYGARAANRKW